MSKLRITYYAEGHRNGCLVTLAAVCGGRLYDDFIIDASRWYSCSASEKEAILLATAHIRYPEINWESAHYSGTRNA